MSLVEYYDQLAEIALGWLGWTPDQALAADVNAIAVAYHGRVDMFNAIFGSGKSKDGQATKSSRPLTPALFMEKFG